VLSCVNLRMIGNIDGLILQVVLALLISGLDGVVRCVLDSMFLAHDRWWWSWTCEEEARTEEKLSSYVSFATCPSFVATVQSWQICKAPNLPRT
jgi:hypothetical protein